jgi:hypothetical protein
MNLKEALPWLTLILIGALFVRLFTWTMESSAATPLVSTLPRSPASSPIVSVPGTFPPEVLMAARAIATQFAPPSPTPEPVEASPVVQLICAQGIDVGTVCEMAQPATTPTPWPQCPTYASVKCEWTGKPGAEIAVTATPSPEDHQ